MKLLIGENIKKLRKEKSVTQEQLAEILGVSCQSVSRWETGNCYPDLELIPIISNYFEISIDELLCNDDKSIEKDKQNFFERRKALEFANDEYIELAIEYYRKYPLDNYYAWFLAFSLSCYISNDAERGNKYLSLLYEAVEQLLDTKYRESAIMYATRACKDEDLDKWLTMAPFHNEYNMRGCLVDRYVAKRDMENAYIQQGLEALECYAKQLDRRFPDIYGAERKAEYQKSILRTIESFDNGNVPDGWKVFYAYKQLVLSACLFGQNKLQDGWIEFNSAVEKYKYFYSLNDEYLSLGGEMFSNLKVNKEWTYAEDENGNIHQLNAAYSHSFYWAKFLYEFLTNPCYAWFDSVRNTEQYISFVNWAEEMAKTEANYNIE